MATQYTGAFHVQRGTNISHWLSQSDRRGEPRRKFFTREDVQRIADWGFDHIRLPIDEVQMWDEAGKQEAEAFDLLDAALDWCESAGLKTIVDLHILRSHYFGDADPPLFTDPAAPEKFADLWKQLSARLKRRPVDRVAYELMNEPVARDDAEWNRVYPYAFNAIRALEPDRVIVVGSNRWSQWQTFANLKVLDDDKQILTFHYYNPMLLTHYRAPWASVGKYTGPVHYPGMQVAEEDLKTLPNDIRMIVEQSNRHHDRAQMAKDISLPVSVAARHGAPLYCGEFGVYAAAPQELRFAWYRDLISVLNENRIGWGNWDYKGGFGLVDRDGNPTGIAEVMLSV